MVARARLEAGSLVAAHAQAGWVLWTEDDAPSVPSAAAAPSAPTAKSGPRLDAMLGRVVRQVQGRAGAGQASELPVVAAPPPGEGRWRGLAGATAASR